MYRLVVAPDNDRSGVAGFGSSREVLPVAYRLCHDNYCLIRPRQIFGNRKREQALQKIHAAVTSSSS